MARWRNYFAESGITRVVDIHHTPIEFNYSHPLLLSLRIGLICAANPSNCRQRMECQDASACAGGEPDLFEAVQGMNTRVPSGLRGAHMRLHISKARFGVPG